MFTDLVYQVEANDLYKALYATIAGLILGFERELKDKSAGLKTITIICLGSALFTIISFKVGVGTSDPGRIAANISTGIGFLGAGVIFKEGFNVYGLTTAGIIWISAAIGMAIGFGEATLGFLFLFCALAIIYITRYVNRILVPQHSSKVLKFEIAYDNYDKKNEILNEVKKIARHVVETRIEKKENQHLTVYADIHICEKNIPDLERYLVENKTLFNFTL